MIAYQNPLLCEHGTDASFEPNLVVSVHRNEADNSMPSSTK